jgi:monothiol glutaredoxin
MNKMKTSIFNKITQQTTNQTLKGLFIKNKFAFVSLNNSSRKFVSNNFINKSKFNFSENSDDIHSDFKPKSKVEITDDNVLQLIDDWVKNNDVVIFMKGTREMPRCGFSNYAVQVLKFYNVKDFKVINILENPIVREAGRKYSNWPTYPQLYVKGNLIGNLQLNYNIFKMIII